MKPKIVHCNDEIISVLHDGSITWDELQKIKNDVWGEHVQAFECYPRQSDVINKVNMRHIWKKPEHMPFPDLDGGWN